MSKTILLVGANRGLGPQFALPYQAKGLNVYGTYRKESVDEVKELLDSGVKTITLDLTEETSIKDASKSFTAGNGSPRWIDATTDEFMQTFRISAVGPYLTTKALHGQLKKSPSLFVINISSNSGSIGENETGGNLSYRTAKAALNIITVDLARELAPDNISVIAISPCWIQTMMSNWTGPMQSPEAVTLMIHVIDGLQPSDTASFYHRDGS